MVDIRHCPVEYTLEILNKKWTLQIIGNLLHDKHRFNQILWVNPGLTSRVLSHRLKKLIRGGIVEKYLANEDPIIIEYKLTDRGHQLKQIIFDLAMFSIKSYPNEIFGPLPGSLPEYYSDHCLKEQITNTQLVHNH